MALRFCTGFNQVTGDKNSSGDAMLAGLGFAYSVTGNYWPLYTGRRVGTNAIIANLGGGTLNWDLPCIFGRAVASDIRGIGTTTLYLGYAFNPTGIILNNFVQFYNHLGNGVAYINFTSGGQYQIYRWDTSAIIATGAISFPTNQWSFMEVSITCSETSTYTISFRINGGTTYSATVTDTSSVRQATINDIRFGGNDAWNIDDIYLLDSSGSTNNAWLGDCQVEYMGPNDYASANNTWTPVNSNNYDAINEAAPNGDTTYTRSTGLGARQTHPHTDLGVTPTSILGVCVHNYAKREGGTGKIGAAVRLSGGATYDSVVGHVPRTDVYRSAPGCWDGNPAGGSWTKAQLDAAEFGPVIIS